MQKIVYLLYQRAENRQLYHLLSILNSGIYKLATSTQIQETGHNITHRQVTYTQCYIDNSK